MLIRAMREDDDFAAVAQLYLTTWRSAYQCIVPAAFLAQLQVKVWQPQKHWRTSFVAENAQQQIVGVCSFGPARTSQFNGYGELYSIYVHPAYANQGIGSALIKRALARLQVRYRTIYLWVFAANWSAIKFYQKFGFKPYGRAQDAGISDIPVLQQVYLKKR